MPPFSTQSSVRSRCSLLKGCIPWPAEFAATYRAKGYWRGETLGAHLRRWAAERPNAVAVIAGEAQLTYEDLNGHADTLAMHLSQLGLRNRDRILVQLTNSPRFFILIRMLKMPQEDMFHSREEYGNVFLPFGTSSWMATTSVNCSRCRA